jgi:type I restriction enzyme, S subunit
MEKKKPEIRFVGFEGEWDETLLNHYISVSNEKNINSTYDKFDIYSVSKEYGVINQIEYQGKSFAGASLTGYHVVHNAEVVYTKSPLKSQPYGIIKTNEGESGIVSALYGVFHPTDEVDSRFIQTYFELDSRLNDYLRPLVNKGAKNTLLISDEDAIKGKVVFPKKEEQEKIVAIFTTLDKLIRKLEVKLEKLRNIKQSLLSQMFTNVNRGGVHSTID